jgi:hypothetical protein
LERPRQQHCSQGPLDPVAEEGRGQNEVVQPVNPAANTATNAPANPAANAPSNALANVAAMPLTMQPMLPTSREMPLQTQDIM